MIVLISTASPRRIAEGTLMRVVAIIAASVPEIENHSDDTVEHN